MMKHIASERQQTLLPSRSLREDKRTTFNGVILHDLFNTFDGIVLIDIICRSWRIHISKKNTINQLDGIVLLADYR